MDEAWAFNCKHGVIAFNAVIPHLDLRAGAGTTFSAYAH
jgi:hypothetical protein